MKVFECSRKAQAFGSSLALTLPSLFAKVNEVEKGKVLNILYDLNGLMIVSITDDPEAIKAGLKVIMEKLDNKTRILRQELDLNVRVG